MSDVTPRTFRDDLLGAFNTYWTALHSDVPIAFPNVVFDPEDVGESDTGAWVRVAIVGSSEGGQIRYSNSVARNHWQRNGKITFEVYVREQASTDRIYDLVDDIALFLENPGSDFAVISNISAPVELGPDGTWFQVSLSADWLYFTDRAA